MLPPHGEAMVDALAEGRESAALEQSSQYFELRRICRTGDVTRSMLSTFQT